MHEFDSPHQSAIKDILSSANATMSTDPFKSLPFELALSVLHYLPRPDTWRLRSVSKAWHEVLSSDMAVHQALESRERFDVADADQAQRLHLLKEYALGRPTSCLCKMIQSPRTEWEVDEESIMLHEDHVAYMSFNEHSARICLLDLHALRQESSRQPDWQPKHDIPRGPLVQILHLPIHITSSPFRWTVLTELIAGIAVQRDFYWLDRKTSEVRWKSISEIPNTVTADRAIVAALWYENQPAIWVFDTIAHSETVIHLPLSPGPPRLTSSVYGLAIDAEQRVFTTFHIAWPEEDDTLSFTTPITCMISADRYSFDGTRTSSQTFTYHAAFYENLTAHNRIDVRYTGVQDRYHLIVHTSWRSTTHEVILDLSECSITSRESRPIATWNNSFYRSDHRLKIECLRQMNDGWQSVGRLETMTNGWPIFWRTVCINARFLIFTLVEQEYTGRYLYVLCFDELYNLPQPALLFPEHSWKWISSTEPSTAA